MARRRQADIEKQQTAILNTLREFPDGLKQTALKLEHQRRTRERIPLSTLGRRLQELERRGLVKRDRERSRPTFRATEFQPRRPTEDTNAAEKGIGNPPIVSWSAGGNAAPDQDLPSAIPLSLDAQRTLSVLRQPRGRKQLVTYDRSFLESYVPGETWYLSQSQREYLRALGTTAYAGQPAGTYARDIIESLIIDLSWGSSRLEGNKYSRIDTEELIRGGHEAEGASDLDRQMILNHKAAIEFLVENAQEIDFNRQTVLTLHALLAENLLDQPEDEGRLRMRPVAISNSVYTPIAVPQIIEDEFELILREARAIPDPMEQSFFAMVHIPYLQPFRDVNKRTSRLTANIPLIKANLCPLSFVDVPEQAYAEGTLVIYEQNDVSLLRDVFVWAYERSCSQFTVLREAMGTPDPIRLNYRMPLRAVVTEVVESAAWPTGHDLVALAERHRVNEADREAFAATALRDLKALRADTIGRYRLRPSQFEHWLTATQSARIADDHRQRE